SRTNPAPRIKKVNRETKKNYRMPPSDDLSRRNIGELIWLLGFGTQWESDHDVLLCHVRARPTSSFSTHRPNVLPETHPGLSLLGETQNGKSSSSWNRKNPALRSCYIEPRTRSVSALSMKADRRVSSDSGQVLG